MIQSKKHTVAIVDDHQLFSGSLASLISMFSDFSVIFQAKNGRDLQTKLIEFQIQPDIILLDMNMPIMNGFETMKWLKKNHPSIKVIALSMEDDEENVLKMICNGAKGYLLKDIHPETLEMVLKEVSQKGYYHTDKVTKTLVQSLMPQEDVEIIELKENEIRFLQLACSELTYAEIAEQMILSPRTIDGYREALFKRFNVKNRIGLVIYGLKNQLVTLG